MGIVRGYREANSPRKAVINGPEYDLKLYHSKRLLNEVCQASYRKKGELAQNIAKMSDKEKKITSLEEFARQAASRLQSGEELSGKDGVLAPLIKQIVEASLEGDVWTFLAQSFTYCAIVTTLTYICIDSIPFCTPYK